MKKMPSSVRDSEKNPLLVASTSSSAVYSPVPPMQYTEAINMSSSCSEDSSGSGSVGDSISYENYNLADQRRRASNASKHSIMTGITSGQRTSNMATMMHLLKSNIGTGILAMPSAFGNAGLWVGTLGIPVMGAIAIHCMHLLVKCQGKLRLRYNCGFLDYEEVAEKAVRAGPASFHNWAVTARKTVSTFLMITQLGFGCVYGLFVAENIRMFISNITGYETFDVTYYMLMILPFMILLNMISSLKHLAYASTCANILMSIGMVIIFVNLLQGMPDSSSLPAAAEITRLPLYFGTAIYAFEGISLILPLKKEMKDQEAFGGKVGVLNTGMVIVACLYCGVGFFGYLKYGDDVQGSITLNLPKTPLNEVCRLMFALAIFLSYALQMYVPITLIWPWVVKTFELDETAANSRTRTYDIAFRASIVSLTFLIAAAIPKLDLFISLIGALSSSCLALIFPPLIDLATDWDDDEDSSDDGKSEASSGKRSSRHWWYLKNFAICLFGVTGFATGTYASMSAIVSSFSHSSV